MIPILLFFLALLGLFALGVRDTFANPRPTDLESEQYIINAVYTFLSALTLGGMVLVIGLSWPM